MYTSELYKKVAESTGLPDSKVKAVAEGLVHEILDCAKKGEPVRFGSFGIFKVHHMKERVGHNPRNKEEKLVIQAQEKIIFQQ